MAEEVKVLCAFRDKYLLPFPAGRAVVNVYYWTRPGVADFIRDKELLKAIGRKCFKPIVLMIGKIMK
ncbi:MAG: hypothetical protein QHH14_13330 [Clostridiales bacterium]|nr:hypothetical protein [Clostridiales bacterium]